jgi:hypothetical protein
MVPDPHDRRKQDPEPRFWNPSRDRDEREADTGHESAACPRSSDSRCEPSQDSCAPWLLEAVSKSEGHFR